MAGLNVIEVNDGNFDQEVLKSDVPVLVDFWAVWCGPCKAIAPIIDTLAATYAGKVKVAKINVDQSTSTPMRYRVQAIPTLIFFKDGKPVEQLLGYKSQPEIEQVIQKLVSANVAA
ncbi:MAG TPA: thioredoxin [Terracidiphilus sp.]|nr:thioredoxin [Terracidiphilus sp.]